ncbi:phosphatidylethanolamine-binding protein [Jimgerdemannia flammicorona]|uniref:Phosphatidylethanolamine-binding protein n=1 Tax=Jimgerdemannia flammicorona TaxID=994334 RepID=A0A433DH12_9FUNG|nr:phosphatidylethanolamine-binding protein [Jimgerdemannia flammicorona]
MPHSGYVPSRIPVHATEAFFAQAFPHTGNSTTFHPIPPLSSEISFRTTFPQMQRITQMYVIPDLLPPSAVPSVDVTLDFGSDIGVIEPGVFVKPANSIRPPILKVANFHEDTRLYTVLMVDPGESGRTRPLRPKQYQPLLFPLPQHTLGCHRTNVALSATSPIVTNGDVALPYIPPHPQRGTKYHRYTVMVLEQPRGGKQSVHVDATERAGFDAAAFRERHGLVPKGVSFFRGVWDEDVTRIYNEILGECRVTRSLSLWGSVSLVYLTSRSPSTHPRNRPSTLNIGTREPIFGKPPKIDPYIMETGRKRKKYLTV